MAHNDKSATIKSAIVTLSTTQLVYCKKRAITEADLHLIFCSYPTPIILSLSWAVPTRFINEAFQISSFVHYDVLHKVVGEEITETDSFFNLPVCTQKLRICGQ